PSRTPRHSRKSRASCRSSACSSRPTHPIWRPCRIEGAPMNPRGSCMSQRKSHDCAKNRSSASPRPPGTTFSGSFSIPKLTERFAAVARLMLLHAALASGEAATAGSYEDVLDAATHGRTSALIELLDRGIDPDTVDAFNNSLLVIAAREGHVHTVRTLLAYGADPKHRNEAVDSALMLGVLKGNREIVDILIDAGAPLNH